MNIAFLDCSTVGSTSLKPIEIQGNLTCYPYTHEKETIERLQDIDIAIVNKTKITKEVIDACPRLKLICVAATGMNNIDLEYAAQKNIAVKNVADYSTNSVAQVTFALVLELINRIGCFDVYVKNGSYSNGTIFSYLEEEFTELAGKRYGIIGMGNIGKKVAAIAIAFGCEVVYYSTSGKNSSATAYKRVELDELLETSDIVSIHAPLNDQTKKLIALPRLQKMKSSAILINVGRGGIVNEEDLVTALEQGYIAGCGLDVYKYEPISADHPFLKTSAKNKMVMLPHIGWASVEARERLIAKIAENIKVFKDAQK
ncbi:MAG: D-2-hydroxyacid dehydrogenase [Prevotellaceae bacterium]|jgi:glycerate dehydrogenase|nr:D-2-hydroxyacid dehydrogenase [Prevotellaceae bacterium]